MATEHVSVIEEIEEEPRARVDLAWKRPCPLPLVPTDTCNLVVVSVWRTRRNA